MRFLYICLFALLPVVATAQDDDKGFLTNLLEDSLTSAGRDVVITGFRGALSSEASMDRLTISDDDGIWLTLDNVILDWNRSALLRGRIEVTSLTAQQLTIARLPNTQDDGLPTPEATPFSLPDLPVSVNVEQFKIASILLDAAVIGQEVALQVTAATKLENGLGRLTFQAQRIDGARGSFDIKTAFAADTNELTLDITLSEAAGGIAATLLNLPNQPSVDLALTGNGPLSDFSADFDLRTDGDPRLLGDFTLRDDPTTMSRAFEADVSGDVTALFAPQYRDFFGPSVALKAQGQRLIDGALHLDQFDLQAQSLALAGTARLGADGWPSFLDISGDIMAQDRASVRLPFGGADQFVDQISLQIAYDKEVGPDIVGGIRALGFDQPDVGIAQTQVEFLGQIDRDTAGQVNRFDGRFDITAAGVALDDPSVSSAIGDTVSGGFDLAYAPGQPVAVNSLTLVGDDYRVSGDILVRTDVEDLTLDMNVQAVADDLSRFSAVFGQTLSGSADVAVDGAIFALSGGFDLQVTGGTTDVWINQAQADAILKGRTSLDIAVSRSVDGTFVDRAVLANDALSLQATAQLRSGQSDVTFDANLKRSELIAPGLNGPLSVSGTATGTDEGWRVDTEASGPFAATAQVGGLVTGPNSALQYVVRLPDIGVFVQDFNGPLSVNGTANKANDGWVISTLADGPSGTQAQVDGLVRTDGTLDLRTVGSMPLGLANPFLGPRNVQGLGRFDIALQGRPDLSSIKGTVSTQNAQLVAPNLALRLQNIGLNVQIANSLATVSAQGNISTGGTVRINGPIALTNGYQADLSVRATEVTLIDPKLYQTEVNAAITVQGPLLGNARIAGRVDIGETEIQVPATGLASFQDLPDITHIGAVRPVARTLARAGLATKPVPQSQIQTPSGPDYALNVTVKAPARIFVRGRGLDAELGGTVDIDGSLQNVITIGRVELIRGQLDILRKRFELDEGVIQLLGGLIPSIRFVATTRTRTGTASVVVTGPVDDPLVLFQSTPEAPQDEVLAQLLFGRETSQISALQAVLLADAVATLAGRNSSSVIGKLRNSFDLDDLDVSTDANGNTDLRVGKYLSENVYTDLTVGSDGTADITINLDLTDNVTVRGSQGSDGGTSLGVFFEKDY